MQEEQFARFSPPELVKIAFFCALLEQAPHSADKELVSRRFKLVKTFLEEVTQVVPIESVYSAMAYSEDEECAALCKQLLAALADSKIPPSLSMWRNSLLYTMQQDQNDLDIPGLLDIYEWLSVTAVEFGNVLNVKTAGILFKVLLICIGGLVLDDNEQVNELIRNPSKLAVNYISGRFQNMEGLCDISAGFPLAAISSVNLHYLFSKCSEFSPLETLEESRREITQSQTHALFSLQKKTFQLNTVTLIIVAFMQERLRVPLVDDRPSLWKLSKFYVRAMPVSICCSVQMMKLIDLNAEESESEEAKFNRALKNQPMADGLQQYKSIAQIVKLMDSNDEESEEAIFNRATKPLVDVVQQKLYKNSTLLVDNYVTRLQLLVSGVGNAFGLSEPCKEYSLEAQLMRDCQQLTITRATPTETIVSKWDKLFKQTILFSVAKSFRPLIARWIRWSLMIHNLRHELAKLTAVGIAGLVNSGKSQLVNKLFQIKVCGYS